METAICKSPEKSVDEALISMPESNGLQTSTEMLAEVAASSPKEETSNQITNGELDIDTTKCEVNDSIQTTETVSQKSISPNLIEHAFKVVKNLFSPEKTRSKTGNAISPITSHQSPPVSPSSSQYSSNKSDSYTSEGETKSAENFSKGEYLGINKLGVKRTSLNVDPHNNTSDSFLTATSFMDESFQSAVSQLDENGEMLKKDLKWTENYFENSQNFNLSECLHDTFGFDETCLENTMLKNGSFFGESIKANNTSSESDKENLNETQILISNCKNLSTKIENSANVDTKIWEENGKIEADKTLIQATFNGDCKENALEGTCPLKKEGQEEEGEKLCQDKDIENLFVNKSFITNVDHTSDENTCQLVEGNATENAVTVKPVSSETDVESFVENSISTTTVVLGGVDSNELDNMLMSLKTDDSSTNVSSVSSFEDCDGGSIPPLEDGKENTHLSRRNSYVKTPQKEVSKSAGSSPRKFTDSNNQLNKSVDRINSERSSHKFPKGKKKSMEKSGSHSNTDISVKNHETLENVTHLPKGDVLPQLQTILSPPEKNIKNFKNNYDFERPLEFEKSELPPDESDSVSVVSQQSYTILNNINEKNLNRPVISFSKSEKNDLSDEFSMKSNDTFINNTSIQGFNSDFSDISSENADATSTRKQSTPILNDSKSFNKFKCGSTQTFVKERPEKKEFDCREKEESGDKLNNLYGYSKPDLLGKAMKIFSSNEESPDFSPVNPLNDNQALFSSSTEQASEGTNQTMFEELNNWRVSSNDLSEINQTFDKNLSSACRETDQEGNIKQKSPVASEANHMPDEMDGSSISMQLSQGVEKTPCSESSVSELNQTFDKKAESPSYHNLNQTFEKKSGTPDSDLLQSNQSLHKISESQVPKLNQTFEKKTLNQTFDKESESTFTVSPASDKFCENVDQSLQDAAQESNTTFEINSGTPLRKSKKFNKSYDINSLGIANQLPEEKPAINQVPASPSPQTKIEEPSLSKSKTSNLKEEKTAENPRIVDIKEPSIGNDSNPSLSENGSTASSQAPISEKDSLEGDVEKIKVDDCSLKESGNDVWSDARSTMAVEGLNDSELTKEQTALENTSPVLEDDKLQQDLVHLIQQQFSSDDIEKICNVADDISAMKLSSQILKSSKVFDKSFHDSMSNVQPKVPHTENKSEKLLGALTPQSLDFLNTIGGRASGRDLSRVSLYAKFDPLVQSSNANSLIDFHKEIDPAAVSSNPPQDDPPQAIQQLLDISPQRKTDDATSSLGPKEDKTVAKDLECEVYFWKNVCTEKEKENKAKLERYESEISTLKNKSHEQSKEIDALRVIIEECFKVISKLSSELETAKCEHAKQVKALTSEKDSYMNHLENTEAAFMQALAKYEKCKETIIKLKANEATYKRAIADLIGK